jgi:hypothetical protein
LFISANFVALQSHKVCIKVTGHDPAGGLFLVEHSAKDNSIKGEFDFFFNFEAEFAERPMVDMSSCFIIWHVIIWYVVEGFQKWSAEDKRFDQRRMKLNLMFLRITKSKIK